MLSWRSAAWWANPTVLSLFIVVPFVLIPFFVPAHDFWQLWRVPKALDEGLLVVAVASLGGLLLGAMASLLRKGVGGPGRLLARRLDLCRVESADALRDHLGGLCGLVRHRPRPRSRHWWHVGEHLQWGSDELRCDQGAARSHCRCYKLHAGRRCGCQCLCPPYQDGYSPVELAACGHNSAFHRTSNPVRRTACVSGSCFGGYLDICMCPEGLAGGLVGRWRIRVKCSRPSSSGIRAVCAGNPFRPHGSDAELGTLLFPYGNLFRRFRAVPTRRLLRHGGQQFGTSSALLPDRAHPLLFRGVVLEPAGSR